MTDVEVAVHLDDIVQILDTSKRSFYKYAGSRVRPGPLRNIGVIFDHRKGRPPSWFVMAFPSVLRRFRALGGFAALEVWRYEKPPRKKTCRHKPAKKITAPPPESPPQPKKRRKRKTKPHFIWLAPRKPKGHLM